MQQAAFLPRVRSAYAGINHPYARPATKRLRSAVSVIEDTWASTLRHVARVEADGAKILRHVAAEAEQRAGGRPNGPTG
jgi:hypothetical protein